METLEPMALASELTGEYVLLPGNKARPLPRDTAKSAEGVLRRVISCSRKCSIQDSAKSVAQYVMARASVCPYMPSAAWSQPPPPPLTKKAGPCAHAFGAGSQVPCQRRHNAGGDPQSWLFTSCAYDGGHTSKALGDAPLSPLALPSSSAYRSFRLLRTVIQKVLTSLPRPMNSMAAL